MRNNNKSNVSIFFVLSHFYLAKWPVVASVFVLVKVKSTKPSVSSLYWRNIYPLHFSIIHWYYHVNQFKILKYSWPSFFIYYNLGIKPNTTKFNLPRHLCLFEIADNANETDSPSRRTTRIRNKPKKYGDFLDLTPTKRRSYKDISSSEEDEVVDKAALQKPTGTMFWPIASF